MAEEINSGRTERRTRVVVFLPTNAADPRYDEVLAWLSDTAVRRHGGLTRDIGHPPIFQGWWLNDTVSPAVVVLDTICVCVIDVASSNLSLVGDWCSWLKRELITRLSEQDIWVVFYPLERVRLPYRNGSGEVVDVAS